MRIAIAQINPIIGDFQGQFQKMTAAATEAIHKECDIVVFPEMAVCGYPPRDLLEKDDFVAANLACLDRLVQSIRGIGVICGFVDRNPDPTGKPLFNAAAVFEDGRILHKVYKQLLPTYDVFDERRHFEPGPAAAPIAYKGLRIGLTVCEDIWNDTDVFATRAYAIDPVARLAAQQMDLLINISASPFHLGKIELRDRMLAGIAAKHRVSVIFANQVGGQDAILFDGASTVLSDQGRIVARARAFDADLITVDTGDMTGEIRPTPASGPQAALAALVMGTRDYVTKCGFSKVVIGLSGGIDSALTACIAAMALGPENVATVFMPSTFTSRDNFEDTRSLAGNLGVDYRIIAIDDIFQSFLNHLSPDYDPADPGITEQNIQARIRGTLLMGISNRDGCLVLSTGNKSELAVGYCTLYGDMNGGLAVISDVPKTLVYDICRHINAEKEIIPERIIEKAPSAELKPDQTDQDDLPPYEIIDPILKGYVEQARGVEDLVAEGFDRQAVEQIIRRVDTNEYKRHQAAPGLKITPKAFGEGRRYPLAKRFCP